MGSPRQDVEIREYGKVRQECERFGMPLVVWAYPRGRDIEAKGGKGTPLRPGLRGAGRGGAGRRRREAARAGRGPRREPGALPLAARGRRRARLRRVVRSAGRVMVLFSGGVKQDDDAAVLRKVRLYMECGATGVMFGRNMWLRDFDAALALTRRVHAILARCPR